jgi:hypothetical protein
MTDMNENPIWTVSTGVEDENETTIVAITEVIDQDGTVGFFEINKTHEGQNEPWRIVMNSWGNPDLDEIYSWYSANNKPIPPLSGYPLDMEP